MRDLPRRPEGIVTDFGSDIELEDGSSWGLDLVGYVRVEKLRSGECEWIRSSKLVRVNH
jgi:hypothetical protein